jgi:hypothetical protein
LEQTEVPVENSLDILRRLQIEQLRSLFQAFLCQLADSERYLTSFSILFAVAQFFDLPGFRLLNLLQFQGFSAFRSFAGFRMYVANLWLRGSVH